MSRFLSDLDAILVDEAHNLWRLDNPLTYESDILRGTVIVPKGFFTDFASVPRLPVVFLLCGDVGRRAAVIHDDLYRQGLHTRATCDAVYREALLADGVSGWRAWLMWAGVRGAGWLYYNASKEQKA